MQVLSARITGGGQAVITLGSGGLAPLASAGVFAPFFFFFLASSDTRSRQEMDVGNGCVLNGSSCHCVYS